MIGAQLGSIGRGVEHPESGTESGTLESLALQRTRMVFGSIAVEIAAHGAASNRLSPTGAVASELMVTERRARLWHESVEDQVPVDVGRVV